MPTFITPEPISVTVEIEHGVVRVLADDRTDTVVEVRPSNPSSDADVKTAEQVRIDCVAGRLQVRAPKRRGRGLLGTSGSIDLTVEVPTGSDLLGLGTAVAFGGSGRLGETRVMTSAGDISLGGTGAVELRTGVGGITVHSVGGTADVRTSSGDIRLGAVGGAAMVKNDNGRTWTGDVRGDLRVQAANGDVSVGRAGGDVHVSTANGSVRVDSVERGSVVLRTAAGEIELGICPGSAARLDVRTSCGRIRNQLDVADGPEGAGQVIEVHAHTGHGDIVIRRAKECLGAPGG